MTKRFGEGQESSEAGKMSEHASKPLSKLGEAKVAVDQQLHAMGEHGQGVEPRLAELHAKAQERIVAIVEGKGSPEALKEKIKEAEKRFADLQKEIMSLSAIANKQFNKPEGAKADAERVRLMDEAKDLWKDLSSDRQIMKESAPSKELGMDDSIDEMRKIRKELDLLTEMVEVGEAGKDQDFMAQRNASYEELDALRKRFDEERPNEKGYLLTGEKVVNWDDSNKEYKLSTKFMKDSEIDDAASMANDQLKKLLDYQIMLGGSTINQAREAVREAYQTAYSKDRSGARGSRRRTRDEDLDASEQILKQSADWYGVLEDLQKIKKQRETSKAK